MRESGINGTLITIVPILVQYLGYLKNGMISTTIIFGGFGYICQLFVGYQSPDLPYSDLAHICDVTMQCEVTCGNWTLAKTPICTKLSRMTAH